jgi:hypothetical protein
MSCQTASGRYDDTLGCDVEEKVDYSTRLGAYSSGREVAIAISAVR